MLSLEIPPEGVTLDVLVENLGRVNFGPGLMDRKGIVGSVTFDWQVLFNWEVYPLPLSDLSQLKFQGDILTPALALPVSAQRAGRLAGRARERTPGAALLPGYVHG